MSTTRRAHGHTRPHRHLSVVPALEQAESNTVTLRCAVLIASKDGADSIGSAIRSAREQATVYVVSDGSTDGTAQAAREAGARVLDLDVNVGKPAALYKAVHELKLLDNYDIISILDDDTTIAPDFMRRCAQRFVDEPDVAIVVGKTLTDWHDELKWNPWVATRAYAYWRYQALVRQGQATFNVLNCISGSNSVYRASVLRQVLVPETPYIVDDTFWTLETHRRGLGRIVYEKSAEAYIADPTTFRDWYNQNLRWMWGTYQGIIGHGVMRRLSKFDVWYGLLIIDWVAYALLWPLVFWAILAMEQISPITLVSLTLAGYLLWIAAGAIALRKWRLVVLAPAVIVIDLLYRVNFVHAAIKAVRQPTVDSCIWESPKRVLRKTG